ncbi:hypothetical protein BGX26_003116 [Mortierella sp. AD094]|nr:hypothetical protein BGX26_003116 [Mortierella sp. AD094]
MFSSGEPKVRNLTIHIDTGNTIGPKGLPLVYGNPDALTLLQSTVIFESSQDCKAKAVEISFKAVVKTVYFAKDEVSRKYEGEQVFYSKNWELEVERPKSGWISKGNYARQCSVLLDPSLPSSSFSHYGTMKYIFEARLKGAKGFGITRSDWIVSQEVWVLNSTLPFSSNIHMDSPIIVQDQWKDVLPYSLSVPTDIVHFGQVIPVTIQLGRFKPGSAQEGEEVIVNNAIFKLRESKTFRAMFVKDNHETSERLMNIAVNTGWPQNVDGWQRTINVSLPMAPEMSADMQTKYLDVVHELVVVIEFRTSKMSKPEKLQAQFGIMVTAPRFMPSTSSPPQYGDGVIHIESLLLLEPPPAIDPEEQLPSYSRHEMALVGEKDKRLELEIVNGRTTGPDGSYLFYGVPEGVTLIRGKVRFRSNYECKGDGIQYKFIGKSSCSFADDNDDTVYGKVTLFECVWIMNIQEYVKQRKISPGQYEESFEVRLPSTLPSSSQTSHGRVSYVIEARLIRKWSLDVVVTKEIWFQPTTLTLPNTGRNIPHGLTPSTTFGCWKNTLPCSITLLSQVLHLGQEVPITIRMDPLLPTSEMAGKGFRMLNPRIRLKQYMTLTSTSGNTSTSRYKFNVVDIGLDHWPTQEVNQFQDTIIMRLPTMPILSPSIDTHVYKIRHSINLMLGVVIKGLGGVVKYKGKSSTLSFRCNNAYRYTAARCD